MEISNYLCLKNRIAWEKSNKEIKTSKLGIIITGEYSGLDEHLVETEVLKKFDITKVKEIFTVGKKEKTFKYVNRFAKKFSLPVNAFRLETYSWEDIDFHIKRNANIVYSCESVIIFHGDCKQNIVAWYALSVAELVIANSGKRIFVNFSQKPDFTAIEKEIYEVLQMREENYGYMEVLYWELMAKERNKFVKYVKMGENLDFKQILYKLSEVYVKGNDENYFDGHSLVANDILFDLGSFMDKDFDLSDRDAIYNYLKKEVYPNFPCNRNAAKEADICFVMCYHLWYEFEYMMRDMVSWTYEYDKRNEEICAALCFGKWLSFLQSTDLSSEKIIKKYKNLKKYAETKK